MVLRSLLAGRGRFVGLGLILLAPACASNRAATPPHAPAASPANGGPAAETPTQPTRLIAVQPDAPAAPADPSTHPPSGDPATPAPATPATPMSDATPATPATPAGSIATATPPLPGPVTVNVADELPFLASNATASTSTKAHDTKPSGSKGAGRPKKLPPGTTGQRSTHHGRRRAAGGTTHRPYHPDPGIIVDVTSVGAGANQADVQRLARAKGYTPFRHCYEEGLRRDQKLGGKVSMDLVLAADGTVSMAKKTASTVGDASVDQCVVREASHLALARPDSGTPTVAMVVTLAVGDEPVPVPHAAPHADKLRDALRARWSGVEVCYKQGLDKKRDLGGRIEVRFKVKPTGDIVEVGEGDTHFSDADVSKCVVGVFKGAKLPKVGGKHETSFVYAIHLEAIPVATTTVAAASPATATTTTP